MRHDKALTKYANVRAVLITTIIEVVKNAFGSGCHRNAPMIYGAVAAVAMATGQCQCKFQLPHPVINGDKSKSAAQGALHRGYSTFREIGSF